MELNEGVQKQQVEEKLNALTPTKESNSEVIINDEIENAKKLSAFIRKILHNNDIPEHGEKMEWPLCLLMESKQSVTITQQELKNMVLNKAAEVMATRSRYANQIVGIANCKGQQRAYYKKYKDLLKYVNIMSSELELLKRVPDIDDKHVRNVGTYINMPKRNPKKL